MMQPQAEVPLPAAAGRSSRRRAAVLLVPIAVLCAAAVIVIGAVLQRWNPDGDRDAARTLMPTADGAAPPPTSAVPGADDEILAPGGLADAALQGQVWSTIRSFYANMRDCQEVSLRTMTVAAQPDETGSWTEEWIVVACGTVTELTISFTVTQAGDIYYDIAE